MHWEYHAVAVLLRLIVFRQKRIGHLLLCEWLIF